MFAHDDVAAFLLIKKKNKEKTEGLTAGLYCYSHMGYWPHGIFG